MVAIDEPNSWVPGVADIALAASLAVVAVLSGLYLNAARPDTVEPSTWWHWALIVAPPILVAFRRTNPRLIVALATAAQTAVWVSDLPEVLLPMIVILYTASSEPDNRGIRAALASSAVLTAVTAIGVRLAVDVSVYQLPLVALTCGTAVALGVNAAKQQAHASQLAAAAAHARLTAQHHQTQAVEQERAHIGRELHDIIGHSLSVIAVRAEAANRVGHNHPTAASDAVADIATSARAALSDTRRVLAGLQQSSTADLAPPPDLGEIRRFVNDLGANGIDITFTDQSCLEVDTSPIVAGSAYRIVQEAVTNAIKHGGPDVKVTVEVDAGTHRTSGPEQLRITVTNTVSGGPSKPTVGGSGLAGMAERAAVLGGTFSSEHRSSEHRDEGQFVIHAMLPIGHKSNPTEVRP